MKSIVGSVVTILLCSFPSALAEEVPFDSPRWTFQAQEHRLDLYDGRKALFLKGGSAVLPDVEFKNGIIEFDIAFTPERNFTGALWRSQDAANYENFYLRPHQSGNPDANQYTPVFNGVSAWQLYYGEGYAAAVEYRFEQWMHVKIVVCDQRAEIYIMDMEKPALTVPELKRPIAAGGIGLTSGRFATAYFAGFRFQSIAQPALKGVFKEPQKAPAGTLMHWSVSSTFREDVLGKAELADDLTGSLQWQTLEAESTGIVNLARLHGIEDGKNTVFARLQIAAEEAATSRLLFGYSDRVKVYLNGRLLYAGSNDFLSRDYRYLGTIGLFDELYLPLDKGQNEVWLAVSEGFGGWGVMARLISSRDQ